MATVPISQIGSAANANAWFGLMRQPALDKMVQLLDDVQSWRDKGTVIYPSQENVLNALATVHPTELKCVILGQDPYIKPGQAMGLAFSVPNDVLAPPSLENILGELAADDVGATIGGHDLTPWTRQGVMLLNTSLTVQAGMSASHSLIGWDTVTRDVVRATLQLPQPVVYLLWGRHAHKVMDMVELSIDPDLVSAKFAQRTSHPSPLGCRHSGSDYRPFMGSRPFSYANRTLEANGSRPINWSL